MPGASPLLLPPDGSFLAIFSRWQLLLVSIVAHRLRQAKPASPRLWHHLFWSGKVEGTRHRGRGKMVRWVFYGPLIIQISRALRPFIPVFTVIAVVTEVVGYTFLVSPQTYLMLALILSALSVIALLEQMAEWMYEMRQ
jgi:hypothetical protein